MPKQISSKIVALTFGVLVVSFLAAFYVMAWQEPGSAPPLGNVAAPLNVSNVEQTKTGNLVINALGISATGAALLVPNGNVGIGTTNPGSISPTSKLDVWGSIPGTDVAIFVHHADNTNLTSDATFQAHVAGANGGDPRLLLTVAGTRDWSVGVDNSDSDKLKIGPHSNIGTNTKLTIDASGNVGIGTASPGEKLDINGKIKITDGSQGVGKVLTSDASGVGTWQTAFGANTLVLYGYYDENDLYGPGYYVPSCPSGDGWIEGGLGMGAVTYRFNCDPGCNILSTGFHPAYRTCFRTDRACLALVNYGTYDLGDPGGYSVPNCPTTGNWVEAGLGTQPPQTRNNYSNIWDAFRTCYLCP